MIAKINTMLDGQEKFLKTLVWLMIFFYLMDFVGSAIQSFGITETQIGRDIAGKAFHDTFLIVIAVYRAGGDAVVRRLTGEEPKAEEPPKP